MEQLSIFHEEQSLLDGLFRQFDSIPPRNLILNHIADLQLTYGLTSRQAEVLFLISVVLVGIERGLIPVAVLVTPPLSAMGGTKPTFQGDFSC